MLDKRALLLFGLLLLVVIVVVVFVRLTNRPSLPSGFSTLKIGASEYQVEIAESLMDKARGLSGRSSLAEGTGMLFVFDAPTMQTFWMKGMQFPLDFVWIRDGKVIGVTENVQAQPQTAMYAPPAPIDFALELPAGTVRTSGIKVGDSVVLERNG